MAQTAKLPNIILAFAISSKFVSAFVLCPNHVIDGQQLLSVVGPVNENLPSTQNADILRAKERTVSNSTPLHTFPLPSMARASVSSGTRERQKESRDELVKDIDEALNIFGKALDDIAVKHGR